MSDLLLGVDIGTSSSKGVLVRPDGTIVATAQRAHQLSLPRPGWAEHDGETVWWADFVAIARELTAGTAGSGDRVAAVGVSGIGPAVLPVDGAGASLRPAILYGIDTRAMREVDEMTERFGADAILARGGTLLTSQAAGPKLAWIRRNEPDVWARTRRFHMAHSLVIERLTGEYVLDHHSASQCDPLYDMTTAGWATDWAQEAIPGVELPRLAWSDEVVGRVRRRGCRGDGPPGGDSRGRRHDRRMGGGAQRRRPRPGRHDAHVRQDDVHGGDRPRVPSRGQPLEHPGRLRGDGHLRGGPIHFGRPHRLAAGHRRAGLRGPHRRGSADAARRRRPRGAPVLRRGALTDLRSAGTRRDLRPDPEPRPGPPLPGRARRLGLRGAPQSRGDEGRGRPARAVSLADVVKVSRADLDWLYPGIEPDAAAAARRAGSGPRSCPT